MHFAQHQRLESVEFSVRCQIELFYGVLVDLKEEKYFLNSFREKIPFLSTVLRSWREQGGKGSNHGEHQSTPEALGFIFWGPKQQLYVDLLQIVVEIFPSFL